MSDFILEFRQEMARAGLHYGGDILPDGKLHRIKCGEDREANSWYVLHQGDPVPAGAFGCWKRAITQNVTLSNGRPQLNKDDYQKLRAKIQATEKERKTEEQSRQDQARDRAAALTDAAQSATPQHPYLKRKHVDAHGELLESPDGDLLLPLRDSDGTLHSIQTIDAEGQKRFLTGGRVQACFFTVNARPDSPLVIAEGYATAATIHEATGWATVAAMNCGNLAQTAAALRAKYPDRPIIIAADNDTKHPENPGLEHATTAAKQTKSHLAIPEFSDLDSQGTDFNDLALSSGLAAVAAILEKSCPCPLSILSFDEINAIPISESDRIMGDHLLDKGTPLVIAGQGGTGKSRLIYQFLAACIKGADKFLTFDLHLGCGNLKWLVLQTENSLRRLRQTSDSIKPYLADQWPRFNHQVRVLTPINDLDLSLALDDPDTVLRLQKVIATFAPDGIIFDSLYDFSVGDICTDVDMRATIMALSRLGKHHNPRRSLIILHHAITGTAGAAKATGYDRASFARNSKVLYNWTRAQINLAPVNEDNNDQLIVSCAKCSDGKEFPSFAIQLNPQTLLFECDPSVDIAQWAADIKGRPTKLNEKIVLHHCSAATTKKQLAKKIAAEEGVSIATAFRAVRAAIHTGKLNQKNDALFIA